MLKDCCQNQNQNFEKKNFIPINVIGLFPFDVLHQTVEDPVIRTKIRKHIILYEFTSLRSFQDYQPIQINEVFQSDAL